MSDFLPMTNSPSGAPSPRQPAPRTLHGRGAEALSLNRVSAAEQVADLLTAKILDGTLAAGQRLRESTLASTLGISRNSVREGLRLLEQGRLLRYEMHRGAVVTTPSVDELDDLYRTRLHLETAAAAIPPTPLQAAALQSAFDALVAAGLAGQARELVAADMTFHAAIVALLGSHRLDAFYRTVATEMGYYLLLLSYTDDEHQRADELIVQHHRALLEVILSGDAERARDAVSAHLRANHARIRQILDATAVAT